MASFYEKLKLVNYNTVIIWCDFPCAVQPKKYTFKLKQYVAQCSTVLSFKGKLGYFTLST